MRSWASRTPHEAELLFGLITQRRAGGQRAASTGAPRRNKAQGAVVTPRAAATSLVRCLSSDRPRTIGEATTYGKPCWLHSKGSSISEVRSERSRGGTEGGSTVRAWWSRFSKKKKKITY